MKSHNRGRAGIVSTPYFRGRSLEYRVLNILRREGWLCSRSAASHGPIDVFAGKNGQILLIQVKSGKAKIRKQDIEILKVWAEAYNARSEVWHFKNRKLERIILHDEKTKNGS